MVKEGGFGGRGNKRHLTKAMFSLAPEQLDVLRQEAAKRALERKAGRMDAGEVVREAVDAWVRAKDDPVQLAMEQMQRAMEAGDHEAAKQAADEFTRLTQQRAKEALAQVKASFDAFVKRVRGRK